MVGEDQEKTSLLYDDHAELPSIHYMIFGFSGRSVLWENSDLGVWGKYAHR